MARITVNEIENYQLENTSEFFALKNDKDVATVHFLADSTEDLDVMVVHKVQIDGKNRYVNCLRSAFEPVGSCPLCESGFKVEVRIFIQMYDLASKKIKVWDRGRTFLRVLEPFTRRIKPLYKKAFDIERSGVAGDMKTTYALFPREDLQELSFEELPEKVEITGTENGIVLNKSFNELYNYVQTGSFDNQPQQPIRRTTSVSVPANAPIHGGVSSGNNVSSTIPSRRRNY